MKIQKQINRTLLTFLFVIAGLLIQIQSNFAQNEAIDTEKGYKYYADKFNELNKIYNEKFVASLYSDALLARPNGKQAACRLLLEFDSASDDLNEVIEVLANFSERIKAGKLIAKAEEKKGIEEILKWREVNNLVKNKKENLDSMRKMGCPEPPVKRASAEKPVVEKAKTNEEKFRQAKVLLMRRQFAWVIHDMSEILKTEPENTDALIFRANAYLSLYDYFSAMKKEKVAETFEKLKSDWEKAWAIAEKILKANPNQAEALNVRGSLEAMNNYSAEAVTDFTQAIKVKPDFIKAYMNRAEILSRQQEYDKAFADYTTVIKFDPNYTLAYLLRGKLYSYPKEDYDAAIKDYTTAISLYPDLDVAYDYRGYAYKNKENFSAAIADLTKAIEIDPQNTTNWFDRGNIYGFMQNKEMHDADYGRGVEISILYKKTELDDYEGQMRNLADAKVRERKWREEDRATGIAKSEDDLEKELLQLIKDVVKQSAVFNEKLNAKNKANETSLTNQTAFCKSLTELEEITLPLEATIDKLSKMYKRGDLEKVANGKLREDVKQIIDQQNKILKEKENVTMDIKLFRCREKH